MPNATGRPLGCCGTKRATSEDSSQTVAIRNVREKTDTNSLVYGVLVASVLAGDFGSASTRTIKSPKVTSSHVAGRISHLLLPTRATKPTAVFVKLLNKCPTHNHEPFITPTSEFQAVRGLRGFYLIGTKSEQQCRLNTLTAQTSSGCISSGS